MGWILEKGEAKNFMSFKDCLFELKQGEVTIVYGKNNDTGDDKSNGSGKSALLEIIGFGITGTPLRKIKIGELVNDDFKSGFTKVQLYNKGLGKRMIIDRNIYKNKSSSASVTINGNNDLTKHLVSTDDVNNFIISEIGISREDIFDFFILTSSKTSSFLDASDTKKKQIINRFSNGVLVDSSIEEITEDIESIDSEKHEVENELNSIESTLSALKSTLEETKEINNVDSLEDVVKSYKEKILEYENYVKENSSDLPNLNLKLKELKDSLSKFSVLDLEQELKEFKQDLELFEKDRYSLRVKVNNLKHEKSSLEVQIEGSLDCPKCGHEFDPTDSSFDIRKAEKRCGELSSLINKTVIEGKKVASDIEAIMDDISEIQSEISEIRRKTVSIKDQIDLYESKIRRVENSIDEKESLIKHYKNKISLIKEESNIDNISPIENKISKFEDKLIPVKERFSEIENTLSKQKEQLDIFKRFKSYLANKSLKLMESLTNDYLEKIGSDIFIQLSSQKKLSSGKKTEKIDSILVRNGIDIGSFNKRSGGEKAAINLSFSQTLSHLINLNAGEDRGLDFTIIDEVLDCTDAEGMGKIVRSYEKSNNTVMLITHIPLPKSLGNPILVKKENDVSVICNYE